MIHRAFRYRLYPTAEQVELLQQTAGVVRLVYNLAWEQRRDWWRQFKITTGMPLNFMSQGREVTKLRAAVPFIAAVAVTPMAYALRDLDRAFSTFYAGGGYPKPRKRGVNDNFRHKGTEITVRPLNARWSTVRVPKIGWVKFRSTRAMRGRIVSVTFATDALGWHVSFVAEIDHNAPTSVLPSAGIDRGVANTIALSTGELLSTTDLSQLERRKKRAQRILARRQRGSVRYRKQRQRLSRITAKIARCRADWRHKVTTDIAERFGVVAVEDLKTSNMTRAGKYKRGLNRSILEQGWHTFATVLTYKLEERGGTLFKVNPAHTSQECSACGVIDSKSRESQSRFCCRHCGFTDHADTNAAKNILRRSTAGVEGAGYSPVETRTINHALAA